MGTRPSAENVRNLLNFTQMFRWSVAFPSPPKAVDYPGDEAINFRAESVSLPKLDPGATEIVIRGSKTVQPGIADYGNEITLTCIEAVDNVISKFLASWQTACWENTNGSTGKTRNIEDIDSTMMITRLDNMDEPIWKYELFGCYLKGGEAGGELGADSADPLKPSLVLAFQYFTQSAV